VKNLDNCQKKKTKEEVCEPRARVRQCKREKCEKRNKVRDWTVEKEVYTF
jgi:hypothetical protein